MLTLKKGTNNIVVKASNKGGTVSERLTITFRDKIQTTVKDKVEGIVTKTPSTPQVGANKGSVIKGKKIKNPKEQGGKTSRKGF